MNELLTPEETNVLIARGAVLHVAGDESALRRLRPGHWIGGTTPYMLTRNGGIVEREKVFVTELPVRPDAVSTRFVDIGHIPAISVEAPRFGFTIVIIPSMSEVHSIYSLTSASIPGIRDIALIGWVAGVHTDVLGTASAKVFDGVTGEIADDRILVMHATLPSRQRATVDIVNLVVPDGRDIFVFDAPSFSVQDCEINGRRENFCDYALRNRIGIHQPLLTELNGETICVSLKSVDTETRSVQFFAPVMRGRAYRLGDAVNGYRDRLIRTVRERALHPVLAWNCFHNYCFGGLMAPSPYPLPGPAVFGELVHVLMNQTLVCLSVKQK
jgi:hypothetical protein